MNTCLFSILIVFKVLKLATFIITLIDFVIKIGPKSGIIFNKIS